MTATAQQVALAIVSACKVVGVNPAEAFQAVKHAPKARLLASIGLVESGLAKPREAARVLAIKPPTAICPSARLNWGIYSEHVAIVVQALGGLPEAPEATPSHLRTFTNSPAFASEAGRKEGQARRSSVAEAAPVGVIDVAARALAVQARPMIEMRRTDADRAVPKAIRTRALLGDPKPGRTPWAAPVEAEDLERQARLERLSRTLIARDGPEQAARIMADKDPATNRDIADWRGLGR